MNVRRLFAPISLSMAYLAFAGRSNVFQNTIQAQEPPALTSTANDLESTKQIAFQETKLQSLIALSDDKASEIISGLKELKDFYEDSLISPDNVDYNVFNERRGRLIEKSKAPLENLFLKCLQLMNDPDIGKQKIGAEAITIFSNLFPSGCGLQISDIVNAKKHATSFFIGLSELPPYVGYTTSHIKAGLGLLYLANDGKTYPQMFTSWLKEKGDNINADSPKELQLAYEEAVRGIVLDPYRYLPNVSDRCGLIVSLLPAYVKAVQENSPSPQCLKNVIPVFCKLGEINPYEFTDRQELDKELIRAMTSLFDIFTSERAKTGEFRGTDARTIFILLRNIQLGKRGPDMLTSFADSLSRSYFSGNRNDTDGLMAFINAVDMPGCQPTIPAHLVVRVVSENPDYFIENVKNVVQTAKESPSIDERSRSLRTLGEFFVFFHKLPEITQDRNKEQENKELCLKIKDEVTGPIENLIISTMLIALRSEHVTVTDHNEELVVENRTWRGLNEGLDHVLSIRTDASKDFLTLVRSRLNNDTDYVREMDYETLGVLLASELASQNGAEILEIFRKSLTEEDSPQALRGMSKALASALIYEKCAEVYRDTYDGTNRIRVYTGSYVSYRQFFRTLRDFSEGKIALRDLVNVDSLNLSPIQRFILDQVRILNWDFKICKDLLPEGAIISREDENGEEQFSFDKEGYLALQKLRRNAFFVLSSTAIQVPDYSLVERKWKGKGDFWGPFSEEQKIALPYKTAVLKILERDFERNYLYDNPDDWGIYTSVLIEQYLSVDNETLYLWQRKKEAKDKTADQISEDFIRDRLGYLKDILFDSEHSAFNHYTGSKDELRNKFASQALNAAPLGGLRVYKGNLVSLGFPEYKLNEILENSMKIKIAQK